MAEVEKRLYKVETKSLKDENGEVRGMEGIAAVSDNPSKPMWIGNTTFVEIIEPRAFKNADISDVIAAYNHDTNQMLARTLAGTLEIKRTDNSLGYSIPEIAPTTFGNNLKVHLSRGEITENSFAFTLFSKDDGDDSNGDEWRKLEDGTYERRIKEGGVKKLYDVAPVVRAQYPNTSIEKVSLRSFEAFTAKEISIDKDEIAKKEIDQRNEAIQIGNDNLLKLLELKKQ